MLMNQDIRSVRDAWRPDVLITCCPRASHICDVRSSYQVLTELTDLTELARDD